MPENCGGRNRLNFKVRLLFTAFCLAILGLFFSLHIRTLSDPSRERHTGTY